jgi:hypothetical protein
MSWARWVSATCQSKTAKSGTPGAITRRSQPFICALPPDGYVQMDWYRLQTAFIIAIFDFLAYLKSH